MDHVPARVVGRGRDRRGRRCREEVPEARVGGGVEGDRRGVGDLELGGAGRVVIAVGHGTIVGDEEARGMVSDRGPIPTWLAHPTGALLRRDARVQGIS